MAAKPDYVSRIRVYMACEIALYLMFPMLPAYLPIFMNSPAQDFDVWEYSG
jgi:uncharacterized membrane protein (DUF485 family)